MKPKLYQFIQTPVFSGLLDNTGEESLLELIEVELAKNPLAGSLLKGGMRKVCIASATRGEGKRGGYRVWFYFDVPEDKLYPRRPPKIPQSWPPENPPSGRMTFA